MVTNQKGFTLLEVLVAAVILAVGILGVATMQISSIQGNSHGRQISEATNVISDRIEELLALEYDDASGLLSPDPDKDPDHGPVTVGNYIIWWNITIDHPIKNTKTIQVIVEPPGRAQNFSFDMVKADL